MKVTISMILFFVLFLMLLIVHEGIEGFLCPKQFVEEERSKEENRSSGVKHHLSVILVKQEQR